jgi:tricorn protease
VDGRPVDPVRGPNAALSGKAGKPVELTLCRDGEPDRRVAVVPIRSENVLRYQDLIRTRRARVHELSDGRIGYVHVPDMAAPGWADFHRDLHSEIGREGLIVDVRSNNGGHTSGLVIEKLTRKIIGWDAAPQTPFSYPFDAPRGPLVAVSDECAGSDGDIVTHAFKRYGLGPVVGTRTWGGVVGIDMKYSLVDGTLTTQPKYAFWFDNGTGWGVENYGVDPDVEVVITPQDWAAGRDPQLREAVRLALEELERNPAATPPPLPPLPPLPSA